MYVNSIGHHVRYTEENMVIIEQDKFNTTSNDNGLNCLIMNLEIVREAVSLSND